MNIEDKVRIDALKTASLVLSALADSFNSPETKAETKSLAWAVSWAVIELIKYKENNI